MRAVVAAVCVVLAAATWVVVVNDQANAGRVEKIEKVLSTCRAGGSPSRRSFYD